MKQRRHTPSPSEAVPSQLNDVGKADVSCGRGSMHSRPVAIDQILYATAAFGRADQRAVRTQAHVMQLVLADERLRDRGASRGGVPRCA